jgi:hypothetical protein
MFLCPSPRAALADPLALGWFTCTPSVCWAEFGIMVIILVMCGEAMERFNS